MTESRLSAMVGAALRGGITIDTRTGPPGSAEIKAIESPHARCLDGGLVFTRAIWRATPLWGRRKPCIMRQPDRGPSGERPVGVGEEGGGRLTMINEALRTIAPIAGWGEERLRAVEITGGGDPILPTPFRIGETSAAALAAVGLAVSDLWTLRTGRQQAVAVD